MANRAVRQPRGRIEISRIDSEIACGGHRRADNLNVIRGGYRHAACDGDKARARADGDAVDAIVSGRSGDHRAGAQLQQSAGQEGDAAEGTRRSFDHDIVRRRYRHGGRRAQGSPGANGHAVDGGVGGRVRIGEHACGNAKARSSEQFHAAADHNIVPGTQIDVSFRLQGDARIDGKVVIGGVTGACLEIDQGVGIYIARDGDRTMGILVDDAVGGVKFIGGRGASRARRRHAADDQGPDIGEPYIAGGGDRLNVE